MTEGRHVAEIAPDRFPEEFRKSFDNPTRIWEHAFNHQLFEPSRHILMVMLSLPSQVRVEELEVAFAAFYKLRRRRLGFAVGSNDFAVGLRQLEGDFLATGRYGRDVYVEFSSPSVEDYLRGYLREASSDALDLINGSVFFAQLEKVANLLGDQVPSGHQSRLCDRISVLVDGPECRFIRRVDAQDRPAGLDIWEESFEARVETVLGLTAKLGRRGTLLAHQLLGRVVGRVKRKRASRADLVSLIRDVEKDEAITASLIEEMQKLAKDFLFRGCDDVDNLEAAATFVEHFSGLVSEEDLRGLRAQCRAVAKDYLESYISPQSAYRGIAEQLESIAAALGADVADMVDQLRERAGQEDAEEESPIGGDDTLPSSDTSEESSGDTEESYDMMFQGLLHELERHPPDRQRNTTMPLGARRRPSPT